MSIVRNWDLAKGPAKGSKMRNKPVWECAEPSCQWTFTAKTLRCHCGAKVIHHQSQKEFKRWKELQQLEKAGQIRGLERQKKFTFDIIGIDSNRMQSSEGGRVKTPKGRDLTYTADFVYEEMIGRVAPQGTAKSWQQVVEDVKGRKSGAAYDLYWIKRELMRLCHGITVREV